MENWLREYATKERQRDETLQKILKPFVGALMQQIDADVTVFREEFVEQGRGVTVEMEAGRVQRDFGFNNRSTILVSLKSGSIIWEYKGNIVGKPGRFMPKSANDSVLHVSKTILKPILFPAL
jgi:hypothetical protein